MINDLLTPTVRKLMEQNGWTTADLVRSLRPGGPQDTIECTTHCLSCGAEVTKTFRELPEVCSTCGGDLDGTDLGIWCAAVITKMSG